MQATNEICWCQGTDFRPTPHPDYLLCTACGTAKLRDGLATGQDPVTEEASHLYGEQYWDEHVRKLGFPTLVERARLDLAGRAQYWLKYVLQYRLPPGRTLELGSAHGGFVKLLSAVGFDAAGMEMSPGIVARSREWFGANILRGPIAHADGELGTLDAVLLFDVIEHFADPVKTMGEVFARVAPDGIVVVQTPNYDGVTGPQWRDFKVPEHTFLFGTAGLREFFGRAGFGHVAFEQPLFPTDMFAFASRQPLVKKTDAEIAACLTKTPGGRLALGMQDLYRDAISNPAHDLAAHFGTRGLAAAAVRAAWRSVKRRLGLAK